MSAWTESDWNALAAIVFQPDYPGNPASRGIVEAPNGDGALDKAKKFSHVATKYIVQCRREVRDTLNYFLDMAHHEAINIWAFGDMPLAMEPRREHGALRVLEYPAGVGGHLHTDFDLFSVNLWRSCPNPGLGGTPYHMGEIGELLGLGSAEPHYVEPLPVVQKALVYFAIPDHAACLPSGVTVGDWLNERIARSRVQTTKGNTP